MVTILLNFTKDRTIEIQLPTLSDAYNLVSIIRFSSDFTSYQIVGTGG